MSPDQLSPEHLSDLREAFNLFDRDCSGSIDAAELGALMRALGQRPTDAQIRAMIDDADVDRTGSIEFHEFVAMMTRSVRPTDRDAELRTAFAMFDQDGSGTIDLDELREVMRTIGEPLTDAQVDAMMREADADGSGTISYDEFLKMMEVH